MKQTLVLIIGLVVVGGIVSFLIVSSLSTNPSNFATCKAKGYKVHKTQPVTCHGPDGKQFTNQVKDN